MKLQPFASLFALTCLSGLAAAEPIRTYKIIDLDPASVPSVVNTHTLYLNNCMPNGCIVKQGTTDARTLTSDIGHGTLSAYPYGQSNWNAVVACVKNVMSPFNINVTDVDPGAGVDRFEVLIAGLPQQLGQPCGGGGCVGGIADYACTAPGQCAAFIPNALVFDFTEVWNGNVNQDCATAAQEIAHAWSLDHVVDATDPMTYNQYSGIRVYHDGEACGSDCGQSTGCCGPFGCGLESCSGTCDGSATHVCMSTGTATQDEIKTIKAIFGPAGAVAPTLAITSPGTGSAVQPGFEVDVTCTSGDGVQEVDFSVDGAQTSALSAPPFKFTTATSLVDGSHTISVLCASNLQATATASESVIVGTKCSSNSDCSAKPGFICYQNACIAGPMAPMGLGTTCSGPAQCASNLCESDGTKSACVVPCNPSNDQCPSGFGCLSTGMGSGSAAGVCFPGAAHGGGGGCCDAGGGTPAGPLLLSGAIAALWITRRRKPTSSANLVS